MTTSHILGLAHPPTLEELGPVTRYILRPLAVVLIYVPLVCALLAFRVITGVLRIR